MWENGLFRGGVFFLFAAHLCLLSVSIQARSGNGQRLNYEELERGRAGGGHNFNFKHASNFFSISQILNIFKTGMSIEWCRC